MRVSIQRISPSAWQRASVSRDRPGARLELALGIGQIIRSGLDLMGVAATEEMR